MGKYFHLFHLKCQLFPFFFLNFLGFNGSLHISWYLGYASPLKTHSQSVESVLLLLFPVVVFDGKLGICTWADDEGQIRAIDKLVKSNSQQRATALLKRKCSSLCQISWCANNNCCCSIDAAGIGWKPWEVKSLRQPSPRLLFVCKRKKSPFENSVEQKSQVLITFLLVRAQQWTVQTADGMVWLVELRIRLEAIESRLLLWRRSKKTMTDNRKSRFVAYTSYLIHLSLTVSLVSYLFQNPFQSTRGVTLYLYGIAYSPPLCVRLSLLLVVVRHFVFAFNGGPTVF